MRSLNIFNIIFYGCMTLSLSGCIPALNNNSKQISSDFNIPKKFVDKKLSTHNSMQDNPSSASELAKANWKDFFNDSYLHELIGGALKNNQELHILEQEIAISRNEISARRGEYLPKLGVGSTYEIEKVGEYTSQGKSDDALDVPSILRKKQAGLLASWELDIWNKFRNSKKSAYYSYLSSKESRKFMVTQLVSQISSNYYKLIMLDEQLLVVKQYIDTLKKAQKVVEYQKEAARATSLAVNRFSAEVFKNYSLQYRLQQEIVLTENKLNALVGRMPQPIKRSRHKFLPLSVPTIHAGLPSELLENRPDIQQATLNIKAAKLDVKVAKARFYPSLSLDADIGLQSFDSKYFLNTPTSLFYNAATNISAPLLNRLAIEADYKNASSKQLQTVYKYQKTVINGYIEVINQLNSIKNMNQTYSAKEQQVSELNKSIDVSDILFKAARIDYLEALLVQRDALEAQMDLIEIKQKQMVAYINLYRALGGGWRIDDRKNVVIKP
jgi:outer membrane protein, multidrug efflux system